MNATEIIEKNNDGVMPYLKTSEEIDAQVSDLLARTDIMIAHIKAHNFDMAWFAARQIAASCVCAGITEK